MQDVLLEAEKDLLLVKLQPNVRIRDRYEDAQGNRYKAERIAEEFSSDVAYFRAGRYSYMSDAAKERILKVSDMVYNYADATGRAFSDVKMLGLIRHKALKDELEAQLETTLDDHQELLPAPKDEWLIRLADLTWKEQGT